MMHLNCKTGIKGITVHERNQHKQNNGLTASEIAHYFVYVGYVLVIEGFLL